MLVGCMDVYYIPSYAVAQHKRSKQRFNEWMFCRRCLPQKPQLCSAAPQSRLRAWDSIRLPGRTARVTRAACAEDVRSEHEARTVPMQCARTERRVIRSTARRRWTHANRRSNIGCSQTMMRRGVPKPVKSYTRESAMGAAG